MKAFQEFSLVWVITSVLLIFGGVFLWTTSVFTENPYIGKYFMAAGSLSLFLFIFTSLFYFAKSKNTTPIGHLLDGYVILSCLLIIGGLVAKFLQYQNGMTLFIVGLGMMGAYWIGVLIKNILAAE